MRTLFVLLLTGILVTSCNTNSSAYKFSETIVGKEKSLEYEIGHTEQKVKDYISEGHYDSMAIISERMGKLVGDKLNEIKAMDPPNAKYAADFKKDAVDYFAFMKSVYTSYVKYAKAGTEDLRDEEMTHLQEIIGKKGEVVRNMQQSQKRFAEANGFKVK